MDDYLSKPFEETQLLEIVAKWLGKSIDFNKVHEEQTAIEGPLYDLSQIEDIGRGNQDFVHKMIALFNEQSPVSLKELKEAYEGQDFEKIAKIAHRIKPSIEHMGIVSLKKEVREIEEFAVAYGKSERLEYLLKKLDKVLNQVIYDLKTNR